MIEIQTFDHLLSFEGIFLLLLLFLFEFCIDLD